MQHLVFWPHAGAWGAGVILPPCAQLLCCKLYVMKSTKKKRIVVVCIARLVRNTRPLPESPVVCHTPYTIGRGHIVSMPNWV